MRILALPLCFALGACVVIPVPTGMGVSIGSSVENKAISPATSGFGADLVRVRASEGVGPVEENAILTQAATAFAAQLDAAGQLDHYMNGGSPKQRARAAGYCSDFVAENLANGYATEAEVLNAWMHSDKHHQNLMNPQLRRFGLGHAGRTWVLMLGNAC